jgi:alpha-glucosidase (family GH31 glycosyl hydrolase)
MRFKSWVKKMKEALERIGLAYIWHDQQERNISRLNTVITETCNGIERQNIFDEG